MNITARIWEQVQMNQIPNQLAHPAPVPMPSSQPEGKSGDKWQNVLISVLSFACLGFAGLAGWFKYELNQAESRERTATIPAVVQSPAKSQDTADKFITVIGTSHECTGMRGLTEAGYVENMDIRGTHIIDILQAVLASPCEKELQRPIAKYNKEGIQLTLYDGKCDRSSASKLASMTYSKNYGDKQDGCWTVAGNGGDAVIAYRVGEIQGVTLMAFYANILEPMLGQ